MPKFILTFAAVLTMGFCFAQSGAYSQTAEDAPPPAAERPEAPEAAMKPGARVGVQTMRPGERAEMPPDECDEMPPDEVLRCHLTKVLRCHLTKVNRNHLGGARYVGAPTAL